jgi:tRNA-splicing ligase RtcB (3'-phosphate/5'-hydroxy nucleic acid ligase)
MSETAYNVIAAEKRRAGQSLYQGVPLKMQRSSLSYSSGSMPDVHRGIGATVGSVIPTKGAIIPAAVGVDMRHDGGPDNLKGIRAAIEIAVPHGRTNHGGAGDRGNHANNFGTLGTGNHFVEVCLDESDTVWFMLHSGSRGVGDRMGNYFIDLARKDMKKFCINPGLNY